MSRSGFSEVVLEHFLHPRHTQPLAAPDGEGWSGSVESSRFMRIQVRLRQNVIQAASFATYGCAPAIAAGSLLCEWAIGRPVDEARRLTADALRDALGGLPDARRFCADLAVEALHQALGHALAPPVAHARGPGPPVQPA